MKNRRQIIAIIATSGTLSIAGCSSSENGSETEDNDGGTDSDENNSETEMPNQSQTSSELNTPSATVEALVSANAEKDEQRVNELIHSEVQSISASRYNLEVSNLTMTTLSKDPSAESVREAVYSSFDTEKAVQIVSEAENSEVIRMEYTATYQEGPEEGQSEEVSLTYLLATENGEWRIVSPVASSAFE
jgi:hypothetical protein